MAVAAGYQVFQYNRFIQGLEGLQSRSATVKAIIMIMMPSWMQLDGVFAVCSSLPEEGS